MVWVEDTALLGIALGNLTVQAALCVLIQREVFRKRTLAQVLHSRVLVLEFAIFAISVLSSGFFVARLFPVWRRPGCYVFHGVIMLLYEFQLGLFTYVQFCRYIKSLKRPGMRKFEALLVVTFTVSTVLSAYGQDVAIGLASPAAATGTCDFTHDPAIALVGAGLHAVADVWLLAYFHRYIDALAQKTQAAHQAKYRALLQFTVAVQAVFLAWILGVSGVNLLPSSTHMLMMAAVYHLHFTIVVLVTGIPHLVKARVTMTGATGTAHGASLSRATASSASHGTVVCGGAPSVAQAKGAQRQFVGGHRASFSGAILGSSSTSGLLGSSSGSQRTRAVSDGIRSTSTASQSLNNSAGTANLRTLSSTGEGRRHTESTVRFAIPGDIPRGGADRSAAAGAGNAGGKKPASADIV